MEILSQMKEGAHVSIRDPYSRSIAMILELAIDEYLDPWDVDLVRFCKLFIGRLEKSQRVNLLVVGKLIRMAYTVHLLKSTNTLMKAQTIEEVTEDAPDDYSDWMEDDESFKVTKGIITTRDVIVESLIHRGDRPVTLLDLLDALEEVEVEVNDLRDNRARARDLSARTEVTNRTEIHRKMFTENVEEEIKLTWQRVNQFNGHPIPFTALNEGFELDGTTMFISLLYLARLSKVMLTQRSFPRGEIFVKNTSKDHQDLEFGDLDANLAKAHEGNARMVRAEELIVEERPVPNNWNT